MAAAAAAASPLARRRAVAGTNGFTKFRRPGRTSSWRNASGLHTLPLTSRLAPLPSTDHSVARLLTVQEGTRLAGNILLWGNDSLGEVLLGRPVGDQGWPPAFHQGSG